MSTKYRGYFKLWKVILSFIIPLALIPLALNDNVVNQILINLFLIKTILKENNKIRIVLKTQILN